MSVTLLFVHGTGVRATRYAATLQTIRAQVAARGMPLDVRGCFWGEAEGARLRARGASIPGYEQSGGAAPTEADELMALWTVLYSDPLYELRLLRHRPVVGTVPFGREPPSVFLRREVDEYVPSRDLRERLTRVGVESFLDGALEGLRAAPELDDAFATAPADPLEHRRAVARAIVAATLTAAEDAGLPALDGTTRDDFVIGVTTELHGYGMGIGSFLLRPVKGLAQRWITDKLTGDRGTLSDAAAPTAGDVLRFLAHGSGVRTYVASAIRDLAPGPTYLLAHSLGGSICADLLIREEIPGVAGLVTVGSQTPFMYEIGAFPALSHPDPLPDHMPRWLNIYDRRDVLSYIGAGVFGDRIRDVCVDNGQPFPQSHSAYWTNPEQWSAISEFVS